MNETKLQSEAVISDKAIIDTAISDAATTESNTAEPGISFVLERDPCPLVKIFTHKLKKASQEQGFAKMLKQTQGCFALKSNSDPQSLTIKIIGREIFLYSGIKPEAKIVIHTPLDTKGSQKTRVDKLWRHPLYAMRVGRLLEFSQASWIDTAKRFWALNKGYPGMPSSIQIECTDEIRDFVLGEDPEMSLIGTAKELADFFSGDAVFIQSVMSGKLGGSMSFEHAVVLSDLSLQMLLGER